MNIINDVNNEFSLGAKSRVLVDLNESKNPEFRVYSIKQKVDRGKGPRWYRVASCQRFRMTNVKFHVVLGKTRNRVLSSGAKDVHAWMEGDLVDLVYCENRHNQLLNLKSKHGNLKKVSYDPFKTHEFLVFDELHMPSDVSGLEAAFDGASVYCFESSIIYQLPGEVSDSPDLADTNETTEVQHSLFF